MFPGNNVPTVCFLYYKIIGFLYSFHFQKMNFHPAISLSHTHTDTHTHTRTCMYVHAHSRFCSQHRILCNQSLHTPHLFFSFHLYLFAFFCFLHFPSLLSYFYGSDIYPSETKVCAYNSSLSATLAIFSINHFSPNPNPFSKRKKIKFKYH